MSNPESLRLFYEGLVGSRVSDSHWWRVRKRLTECHLEISEENLKFYLKIKQISPRLVGDISKISSQLQEAKKLLLKHQKMTGEAFTQFLTQNYKISPHQTTISRWFKAVGGYRKNHFYNTKDLLVITATAFLYKFRNTDLWKEAKSA